VVERTKIEHIGDAITIPVRPAGVPYPITVRVELVRVWQEGAIVPTIQHTVSIAILTAGIPHAIAIGVELHRVCRLRAVVRAIEHAIAVIIERARAPIRRARVRDQRTCIAQITDRVSVDIRLIGVVNARAVVQQILDAVPIHVSLARIPDAIPIEVTIPRIDNSGTGITQVSKAIAIRVALLLVGDSGAVVREIIDPITVRVRPAPACPWRGLEPVTLIGVTDQTIAIAIIGPFGCLAGVPVTVGVDVALIRVWYERAVIRCIDHPVAVLISEASDPYRPPFDALLARISDQWTEVAQITHPVAIPVTLLRVGAPEAVVHRVGDTVRVRIDWLHRRFGASAEVPDAIEVIIELVRVKDIGAVVEQIRDPILVEVSAPHLRLAQVSDAVEVQVELFGVRHVGANVHRIQNAIAVGVWLLRAIHRREVLARVRIRRAEVARIPQAISVRVGQRDLECPRARIDGVGPSIPVKIICGDV
jgi:hypothetical protein